MAAEAVGTVSMQVACNSNWRYSIDDDDDCLKESIVAVAIDESSAECHWLNCSVDELYLWRHLLVSTAVASPSFRYASCKDRCCLRLNIHLPFSVSETPRRHCIIRSTTSVSSCHRWSMNRWSVNRPEDFDTIDSRPTVEENKKISQFVIRRRNRILFELTPSENLMLSDENSLGISEYRIMMLTNAHCDELLNRFAVNLNRSYHAGKVFFFSLVTLIARNTADEQNCFLFAVNEKTFCANETPNEIRKQIQICFGCLCLFGCAYVCDTDKTHTISSLSLCFDFVDFVVIILFI